MRQLLTALAVLAIAAGTAQAQVTSLEGISMGTHWYGPEYTAEDLKGRVVMVENWGFN